MNKEEIKQWLRYQIDNSLKIPHEYDKNIFYLRYNNSYLRALKLSTITGKPVNQENFKGGENLLHFNTMNKCFRYYYIDIYLYKNYSKNYSNRIKIIKDVLNEYDEYKRYKVL